MPSLLSQLGHLTTSSSKLCLVDRLSSEARHAGIISLFCLSCFPYLVKRLLFLHSKQIPPGKVCSERVSLSRNPSLQLCEVFIFLLLPLFFYVCSNIIQNFAPNISPGRVASACNPSGGSLVECEFLDIRSRAARGWIALAKAWVGGFPGADVAGELLPRYQISRQAGNRAAFTDSLGRWKDNDPERGMGVPGDLEVTNHQTFCCVVSTECFFSSETGNLQYIFGKCRRYAFE